MTAVEFDAFKSVIARELMTHAAITRNSYTAWFARGEMSLDQLRRFTIQFSVFSNHFMLAALNRVINADTPEAAREAKEILLNELGVVYATPRDPMRSRRRDERSAAGGDADCDPAFVATEGTIEGGTFRFEAAHYEWLLRFADPLGLGYGDLGRRRHGLASTLHFCDELFRLYGSADYNEAMGAAFAVENWAAAGFWKELVAGLETFKARQLPSLPLAFFTWHDRIETQHRAHLWDELRRCYGSGQFRERPFVRAGVAMLDAVRVFWDGLDADRKVDRPRVA